MAGDPQVQRVLAVTAHPDDVDFGAAGTIAGWTAAGIEVVYCVVTDGDAGGFDRDVPRVEMPRIRREEQRAAAAAVGVTEVTFLGRPDGRVVADLHLRRDLAREIRRVRPDRVLTQSPVWSFRSVHRSHPDHRAVGEAALSAVYPDARNPFAFPELLEDEGLEPWSVAEVWIAGEELTTTVEVVDVTATLDRKLAALDAHVSQHPQPDGVHDRVRAWLADTAARHGLPAGTYAEVFSVMDTR